MVNPFSPQEKRSGIISYGVSSYGYDARLATNFKIFEDHHEATVIDPKDFNHSNLKDYEGDSCIIPPNSYILGQTIEHFNIPNDIIAICVGKSTYARCGIIVNVTPLEPGWSGNVTLEIANATSLPAKVYANEGICQFLFFGGNRSCEVHYGSKQGKYQNQEGLVTAKVD
jgi:dCTP deaminase